MNVTESVRHSFLRAARQLDLSDQVARLLLEPLRVIRVQVPVEKDDGSITSHVGWRVQHDNSRGPMQGGLRFHPAANEDVALGLASLMTWKTAVANLPFGGAMGAVRCDPATMSSRELEHLTRKLVDQVQDVIGPTRDVLAPDLNTTPQVMAWIMDQYTRYQGHTPAVVTGKPVELWGSRGRDSAAGRGVVAVCREILRDLGKGLKGTRFAVQGFGTVGSHVTRLLHEAGARVVAVADSKGGVASPQGLDVPMLFEHVKHTGTVKGFAGGQPIGPDEVLVCDCDVVVPAAMEGTLTARVANDVRAKLVVEGANAPTEPAADEILEKRGVVVVPDILANAGGATVSYFEWVQNLQHFSWDEARVFTELERLMCESYEQVSNVAKTRKVPLRTAAYMVAVGRVGKATALRGN